MAEDILPKQGPQKKQQEETKDAADHSQKEFYALVKMEKDILAQEQTLFIGSKLDTDTAQKTVRLAFYGQVIKLFPSNVVHAEERQRYLESMQIIKEKVKYGKVDKVVDDKNLHIRELFSKETDLKVFNGLRV